MDWKSIGSEKRSRMKFLFHYNFIIIHIGWISMVLKVIIDHLVGDVAPAPHPIANGPKVARPVSLGKLREFLLEPTGAPPLKAFHQIARLLGGPILDMYVPMVLAYQPLKQTLYWSNRFE